MATAWNSTQETGTSPLTRFRHQIKFTSSNTDVLRHRHHHKLIAGILNRRCGDGHSSIAAALWISHGKGSRAWHIAVRRRMRDQTNSSLGNKLDVPGAKVRGRAVGQELGTDGRKLRTGAITPSQQKLFFTCITRTVALHAHQLEGEGRDRVSAPTDRRKGP